MALHHLFSTSPLSSSYDTWPEYNGRLLRIYYNDALQRIDVYLHDADDGTEIGYVSGGPDLLEDGHQPEWSDQNYKFCDGTTLNYFTFNPGNSYPYAVRVQEENHFSCQLPVCDIEFELTAYQVTDATDAETPDGSFSVRATSSQTPVKYSQDPNVTYATAISGTGVNNDFIVTGLYPGVFQVYAIDQLGCKTSTTVIIDAATESDYVTRWRLEYLDINKQARHRIDIEDLEYSGDPEYVEGGENPFILTDRAEANEDIFTTVISKQADITLNSNTNEKYIDIFTQNERRFRVKYYVDVLSLGNGFVFNWMGFVTPQFYSEPYYLYKNYDITFTATDQLGELKNIDFESDFGDIFRNDISVLQAICLILRKTDIDVPLRESINIYEAGMDSGVSDSALSQTYFDPKVYLSSDGSLNTCDVVLHRIIDSFGARLYQAGGCWRLELIEEKSSTSIPYREFNLEAEYQGNGTENPRLYLKPASFNDCATFAEMTAMQGLSPSYGKIEFTQKLNTDNNLLKTGGFEPIDFIDGVSPGFKGWNINGSSGSGVVVGMEKFKEPRDGSHSALYIDFRNAHAGAYVDLIAETFTIESGVNSLALSFDLFVIPKFKNIYSYFDVSLKIGNQYLSPRKTFGDSISAFDGDYLIDGEWVRIYNDQNLSWQNFIFNIDSATGPMAGECTFKLRIHANKFYDFTGLVNDFESEPTTPKWRQYNNNRAIYVNELPSFTDAGFYKLEVGDTKDVLDIEPDDHATSGLVWRWKDTVFFDAGFSMNNWLQSVLVDNVKLSYKTFKSMSSFESVDPAEEKVYTVNLNQKIKQKLEKDIYHGDIPATTIDGNIGRIAKSYFRLVDGTPTSNWSRSYSDVNDSARLQEILIAMYSAQFASNSRKLSADIDLKNVLPSLFNCFVEKNRAFVPMMVSWNTKHNIASVELLQLKTSTDVDSELDPENGPGGPPGAVYEFTTEFTTESNS